MVGSLWEAGGGRTGGWQLLARSPEGAAGYLARLMVQEAQGFFGEGTWVPGTHALLKRFPSATLASWIVRPSVALDMGVARRGSSPDPAAARGAISI